MRMKRLLLFLLLLCHLGGAALLAVPASREKFRVVQPDGSIILLQRHGDEYYNWTTNEAGQIVEKDADGFWRPVAMTPAEHQARRRRAEAERRGRWADHDTPRATNFGDRKVLCIIANFTDSTFISPDPNAHFTAMLNEEGYAVDGAIGSVRDYYMENSLGLYRPQFDVYGPVTLSQSSAYYDNNGSYRVGSAILEAYDSLLVQGIEIPLADYDTDEDGNIDMVLFYFPGHNQAEGAGEESIWPHQSSNYFGTRDGKSFNRYFCTSELRGSSGTDYSAIGTTCHEFAHSLGLPDFYDTDYETNGENTFTTGAFDLMAHGNYNDSGRRPPYLSVYERYMLGWMADEPDEIGSGAYVLAPVQQNYGYFSQTAVEGEYFILECRNGEGWDSALPEKGLLIYHVDQSSAYDVGGYTGAYLWERTNWINRYGGHPCYYIVSPAEGSHVFPGRSGVQRYEFSGWDDAYSGVVLSDIAFDGERVSFTSELTTQPMILGQVSDCFGNPLSGASVTLSQAAHPFHAAPAHLSGDTVVETGEDGYFEFVLAEGASSEQVVTVRADGFVPVSVNLEIEGLVTRQHFYLPREDEGPHATLSYYDASHQLSNGRLTGQTSPAMAFYYPAHDLDSLGLVGHRIETVHFQASPTVYSQAFVFVMFKSPEKEKWSLEDIVMMREVTDRFVSGMTVTYYIGDEGLAIPEATDLMVGYMIKDVPTDEYPIRMYPQEERTNGDWVIKDFYTDSPKIGRVRFGGKNVSFLIGAELSAPSGKDFRMLGFAMITLVEGVPTVVAPADKTLYRVEWTLDGESIEEPVALENLPEGEHSYMARLLYYDGSSERVYYETIK